MSVRSKSYVVQQGQADNPSPVRRLGQVRAKKDMLRGMLAPWAAERQRAVLMKNVNPPPGLPAPPTPMEPAYVVLPGACNVSATWQARAGTAARQMEPAPVLQEALRIGADPRSVSEVDACEALKPLEEYMTTLVVQNLPGRYTREDVLNLWPADGTYDYLHLPYNSLQRRPLGYFFINFLTHELAVAFQLAWHGRPISNGDTAKRLSIRAAAVQGRAANLEQIKTRKFGQLAKAGFLPLVLNGTERLDAKALLAELARVRSAAERRAAANEEEPDTPSTAAGTEGSSSEPQWVPEVSHKEESPNSQPQYPQAPIYILQR